MTTIRTRRAMTCLTLALMGAVLSGLTPMVHADVMQTSGKVNPVTATAKPVVKIGVAMLQEQEVLSNGTVRTQTTILPVKPHAEKAKTGKR